ncbi:MFS family permease [Rhodopseudomonas julia]|uniref:MFS family permease n=1 Tax=Rhodopseudomonas julia TaxID=200617 RepID=A0ABU0C5A5_9BRAD|nr:MFS transporter [Rhodopseudomonas julia]MDQ0325119.1 MFS family permease [Rhodopseudomonas julia]
MSVGRASEAVFVLDRAAIAAVILGVTAFSVSQGLTYPLISLIMAHQGVTDSVIGLNAGVFSLGLAVSTLAIGPLTARLAGDKIIIVGLAGCSLCLFVFGITDSLAVWFVARFVLGICVNLVFMLSEAWLNAACPDHLRGRISGLYGAGMCAGFAAGPLAIPFFGSDSSFPFAILAVYLAIVAFATAVLSRRARTRPQPSPPGALVKFVRAAPALIVMVFAFGFADIAAISVMPVYFVKTGHSEAFAAIAVTMVALPTALAQPLVGLLLDRLPRHGVALACGLVAGATFLIIPFLESEAAILAVFALMGAAEFALYTCALTLLGASYTGGLLVAGSAVFGLAYAIGSAGGSTATASAMDLFSPAGAPITAGLALFILVAMMLRLQPAR